MKPVGILAWIQLEQGVGQIELARQGVLEDDAVNGGVLIEVTKGGAKLTLGGCGGKHDLPE